MPGYLRDSTRLQSSSSDWYASDPTGFTDWPSCPSTASRLCSAVRFLLGVTGSCARHVGHRRCREDDESFVKHVEHNVRAHTPALQANIENDGTIKHMSHCRLLARAAMGEPAST